MNNKGFTLIELLAVIVILVSVSLIAVAGISASLERREEKECDEQKIMAINAAKIYFSLNPDDTDGQVTVGELKIGGYFNEKSKTDRLNDNSNIIMGSNSYDYPDGCK